MIEENPLFRIADKTSEVFLHNQGLSLREAGQPASFIQALETRLLLSAYTISGKEGYLEASRVWADLTLHLQGTQGIPDGYNLGYHLKVDQGIPQGWYVADTSTVGTALAHLASLLPEKDSLRNRILDSLLRYFWYIEKEWKLPNGAYALGYHNFERLDREPYHCAVAEGLLFNCALHQLTNDRVFKKRIEELVEYQLQNPEYETRYHGHPVANRAYTGEALLTAYPRVGEELREGILKQIREMVIPWAVENQNLQGFWESEENPSLPQAKSAGLLMVLQLSSYIIDMGEKEKEVIERGYRYVEKNYPVEDEVGRPLGHWEGLAMVARDYPEHFFPEVVNPKKRGGEW